MSFVVGVWVGVCVCVSEKKMEQINGMDVYHKVGKRPEEGVYREGREGTQVN